MSNIIRYRKIVASMTVVLATLAFSIPAFASEKSSLCEGDYDCVAQMEMIVSQIEEVQSGDAEKVVDSAERAIRNSNVELHLLKGKLNYEGSSVYRFESSRNLTMITIPADDRFGPSSNVTIVFDNDGNVTQYNETSVTENSDGNSVVTSYINGEFYLHKETDISFIPKNEFNQLNTRGSINVCASIVFGVSTGLGALIASVCTGACVGALTGVTAPACLACVGMFVALGSGSLSQFISCING